MMSDCDVVVVGAGAAGLSAGRRLIEAGLDVRVVEAAARRGGRAFTDTTTFGMAFDRGCHWLHSASVNPYRAIADDLGFAYERRASRRSMRLFVGGRQADEAIRAEAMDAIDAGFAAADAAGAAGRDVAVSEVVDRAGRWYPLVDHWMRVLSSLDPHEISTLDLSRYADTHENYPVRDGYGALVLAHGAAVPVALETAATAIDLSGRTVRVDTTKGAITARAVIVTVSTSVLAAGAIRFTPELPAGLQEAIAACPLGAAEKVVFQLDGLVPDLPDTSYLECFDPDRPEKKPINFTVNPFGRAMAIGQLGGSLARDLEAEGEAAMLAFGREGLTDAFGSGIVRRIVRASATRWVSDPLIRGAYSCALPGKGDLRRRLADPVDGRLFLAGEAVSDHAFSTAHGAHLSGIAAAEKVAATLHGNRMAVSEPS